MPILALDTTSLACSVAVAAKDSLLAELTIHIKKNHSEQLMPQIAAILETIQLDKNRLKAVAVSIGPGSFTGLRIGLATAKAMAYALKIPLVGVPTLEVLAYSLPAPEAVLAPMLDAQKGNIYIACYRWRHGELHEVLPVRVMRHATALEQLAVFTEPVIALGEAAVIYQDQIAAYNGKIVLAPPHLTIPKAGSVALIAHRMLAKGIQHDVAALEPFYIRRSEAEDLWEKRQGLQI